MSGRKLVNISVHDIVPNENQPRKTFDQYELTLLCESIKENGVLQPLEPDAGRLLPEVCL